MKNFAFNLMVRGFEAATEEDAIKQIQNYFKGLSECSIETFKASDVSVWDE